MIRNLLLFLFIGSAAFSQTIPAAAAPSAALDRLGRSTPKSSFLGYLRSAHDGDFPRAANYIQFPGNLEARERLELTRQLLFILDRGFFGNLDSISNKPEGMSDDGLSSERETIGVVINGDASSPIQLTRVSMNGQMLWLISRETIELVPQLFPEYGFPGIEKHLPQVLLEYHLFSMPMWVFLTILAAVPLTILVAWTLSWLVLRFVPKGWNLSPKPSIPVTLFMALLLHNLLSRTLGLPLIYRIWYTRLLILLWIGICVWVIFRVIANLDWRAKEYLARNQLAATQSMLQLGRRLLQIVVILAAILIAMQSFGFDISTALAGLGIGGIAVAFAAQKTLENVFGGISLLSDQSIRVGDSCQFGPTAATVEDIGLRATRFRTMQRSVLLIPNGQLATMNIENLGQRDKILFRHIVGVKYGLDAEKMQSLLEELRLMLSGDARIGTDHRVRFLKFGQYALELELFAYILTADFEKYLSIQEELLLQVMRIIKDHNSEFALPSQTLYVEQGHLPASLASKAVDEAVLPASPLENRDRPHG